MVQLTTPSITIIRQNTQKGIDMKQGGGRVAGRQDGQTDSQLQSTLEVA